MGFTQFWTKTTSGRSVGCDEHQATRKRQSPGDSGASLEKTGDAVEENTRMIG
jgi:hypothetical protein